MKKLAMLLDYFCLEPNYVFIAYNEKFNTIIQRLITINQG